MTKKPPRAAWQSPFLHYGLSVAVFVVGLVLTCWAWQAAFSADRAASEAYFKHFSQQATTTLDGRINEYITLIRGARALFAASPVIDANQWHQFVGGLDLARNYPGIVSFDYVAYVPGRELPQFAARVQQSRPDFRLQHIGAEAPHCIIQYEAPPRHPSPALGSDTCNSGRQVYRAYMRAVSDHHIVVSKKVTYWTRPDRAGVLLVGPVYPGASPAAAAPVGWVSAALSLHQLTLGIIPPDAAIRLQIFEDRNADQPMVTAGTLGHEAGQACNTHSEYTSCLTDTVPIVLPGTRWLLRFSHLDAVGHLPWEVAGSGFIISLLLALALFLWARTRRRALLLANRMTTALRESEDLLSSITNNIFEGIYRGAPEQGLLYLNKSLATMFGYRSIADMRVASGPMVYADPRRRDELRTLLERNGYYRGEEVEYVRRDGSRFIGINNALAVYDDNGKMLYFDGAISDITARKAVEERVYYLARYDSLTGLENRGSFRERVRQEINRAAHAQGHLAVLFLDLDRFKTVNDYLGHNVGDKLLKAVSQRIQSCLKESDTASRQGGDEFLLLLGRIDSAEAVGTVAKVLLETVAGSYTIDTHEVSITPSIGISMYPEHGDNVETLIRNADAAMYHAKARGRFNYQLFTPELDVERQQRVELESDLREALQYNQFTLHYQPQIELATGRIVASEALLRWNHPVKGSIPPNLFIPVAEQSGLIVPLGEWVLREACRQNREWQLAGLPITPVAINISAVQFHHRSIQQTIVDVLQQTGLAPNYLELELTETAVMQDIERTVEVLNRLRRMGIELAIDDFGTGYSSLSYLRWFKISKLKIDQSFIRQISTNLDDVAIIKAIIGLAKNFKLRVVAEGVETFEQLEFMRANDCDDVQGYYYSRPVPADEFARLLLQGVAPTETERAGIL